MQAAGTADADGNLVQRRHRGARRTRETGADRHAPEQAMLAVIPRPR